MSVKKITITFKEDLTEEQVNRLNTLLEFNIEALKKQAPIKKVEVDGNLFWVEDK